MENSHVVRGVLCTVIGAAFWGFSGTCGQYLFTYKNIDPGWLTIVRMTFAGVILITIAARKYRVSLTGIWKNKKDAVSLVIFSIFGLMSCQYTYLTAVSYSNAGTATILQYLEPVIVVIIMCVILKRLPSVKEILAVLLAITGVFLLATHGNINNLAISSKALFWGLSTAMAASLCSLLPVKIIAKWSSTTVTGYGMLIGGLSVFLFEGWHIGNAIIDKSAIFAIIAIVVIGTAAAFTLFLQGVSDLGPVKATVLGSIEPVSAAVISAIWLKTSFAPLDIVAFSLILATVFIITWKQTEKKKEKIPLQ